MEKTPLKFAPIEELIPNATGLRALLLEHLRDRVIFVMDSSTSVSLHFFDADPVDWFIPFLDALPITQPQRVEAAAIMATLALATKDVVFTMLENLTDIEALTHEPLSLNVVLRLNMLPQSADEKLDKLGSPRLAAVTRHILGIEAAPRITPPKQ